MENPTTGWKVWIFFYFVELFLEIYFKSSSEFMFLWNLGKLDIPLNQPKWPMECKATIDYDTSLRHIAATSRLLCKLLRQGCLLTYFVAAISHTNSNWIGFVRQIAATNWKLCRSNNVMIFTHVTGGDSLKQPVAATCRCDLSHGVSGLYAKLCIFNSQAQTEGNLPIFHIHTVCNLHFNHSSELKVILK